MKQQKLPVTLFWIGLVVSVALATIGTWSLMSNLRTLTLEELASTIWAEGGPMFVFWALSVTLGSILAGIGAFVYAKTKPIFSWIAGVGILTAVFLMVIVWTRIYNPVLFGIGGIINLVAFFAIVWIWMKRYARLDIQEKIAGSYKLLGYIFWINATWFICGETAKLHLKAFEGSPAPSPIEIMVFLVLGWLLVLVGEYKAMRLQEHQVHPYLDVTERSEEESIPQHA